MLINEDLIKINIDLKNKESVILEIANTLKNAGRTNNEIELVDEIMEREKQISTSMGLGIAIPHAHSEFVKEASVVFIKLFGEIEWGDDKNVQFVFGIINAKNADKSEHLKLLANLARKIMDDSFREKLYQIRNRKEAIKVLEFLE